MGESPQSNEASATPQAPLLKTDKVTVTTDKATYSRGARVTITITVKDASTGNAINGASVKVAIQNPTGTTVCTGSATSSLGKATLTYRLSFSAARGTYTVTATVSATGYTTVTGQAGFNVK